MKIIKGRKLRRWLTLVNIRGQVVLHREEHIQHHAVLLLPHRAELLIDIPFTLYGRNIHLFHAGGFYHAPQPMGLDATQT